MEKVQEEKEHWIQYSELWHQLLTEDDFKKYQQGRDEYMEKMASPNKSVADYMQYIVFNKNLLRTLESMDNQDDTVRKLTVATKRIIWLIFRSCLDKFPYEVRVLYSYLKFTKLNLPDYVWPIYEKWLKYHPKNVELWSGEAVYVYEHFGIEKAREILTRAISFNRDVPILYKLSFDMLIMEALEMSSELKIDNNTKSEQDFGVKKAQLVVEDAFPIIKNLDFYLSVLDRCEEKRLYELSKPVQRVVVIHLFKTFSTDEQLWNFMAKRELRHLSLVDLFQGVKINKSSEFEENSFLHQLIEVLNKEGEEYENRTTSIKRSVHLCCTLLQMVLVKLQLPKVCCVYIGLVIDIYDEKLLPNELKRTLLADAFKLCHQLGLMCEKDYIKLFRFLLESETGVRVAEEMFRTKSELQKSSEFYELLLRNYIQNDDITKVGEIYAKAKHQLGTESHKVVRLAILFFKTHYNIKELTKIYNANVYTPHENFIPFRLDYLDFTMTNRGLEEAFLLYKNQLSHIKPPCYELHEQMEKYLKEKKFGQKNNSNIVRFREVFKNKVEQFGQIRTEVWIDWLSFERKLGESDEYTKLLQRARNELTGVQLEKFETAVALIFIRDE